MRFVTTRLGFAAPALLILAASSLVLIAQSGLPPNAGQTIREGMSRPRMSSLQPGGKASGGPSGCLMRDASFAILGGNFGPSADGRRLIASRRGAPIGPVTVVAWAPARIDARLSLVVDVEGETVTLDLVDARGASATLAGGISFVVCSRDETFLGGNLRLPTCTSGFRQFRVVAEGPTRLERTVNVSPHAPSAPYAFHALAQGSWVVSASEVRPTPTPTPRGVFPIGGQPRPITALPGCDGASRGFDPPSRTAVISGAQRRVTGVDFVEHLLTLPRPDLSHAFGATPAPTPRR